MSVGLVDLWGRTYSAIFEGVCPVERKFLLENVVIGAFAQSLSDGDGGVVYPYSATDHGSEATEKRAPKGRVPPVYTRGFEGVLFTHELVGALLPCCRRSQ